MPNQNVNKVIYGGRVLIDLTGDTVDPSKLLKGSKAHDKSGAQIEGACTFDVDSTDATAVAAEILFRKTAYVSGCWQDLSVKSVRHHFIFSRISIKIYHSRQLARQTSKAS